MKPGVAIAVGVCGIITVGIAVKQFGPSAVTVAAPETREPVRIGARAGGPVGWSVRSDAGDDGAGGGGVGAAAGGESGEAHGMAGGGTSSGAGAAGLYDSRRRSQFGAGGGAGALGSGSIQAEATVPDLAMPFEGARGIDRSGWNMGEGQVVAGAVPGGGVGGADAVEELPDDGGPTLAIPFDNSPDPSRGDLGPTEDTGVTYSSDGATFSTDAQMIIPDSGKISGDAGSISFTIMPEWGGGDETDASLLQLRTPNVWDNRLQIFKNGRFLRFLLTDNTGIETDSSVIIDNWEPNRPYQVTATWGRGPNGEGVTNFFIDGRLVAHRNFDGRLEIPAGTPLFVGSDLPGGQPGARATLNSLEIYNRQLAVDEVAAKASGHLN